MFTSSTFSPMQSQFHDGTITTKTSTTKRTKQKWHAWDRFTFHFPANQRQGKSTQSIAITNGERITPPPKGPNDIFPFTLSSINPQKRHLWSNQSIVSFNSAHTKELPSFNQTNSTPINTTTKRTKLDSQYINSPNYRTHFLDGTDINYQQASKIGTTQLYLNPILLNFSVT